MSFRDKVKPAILPLTIMCAICIAGFYYVVYDYLRLGVKLGHLISVMAAVSIAMQAMIVHHTNASRPVKWIVGGLLSLALPCICLAWPLISASPLPAWEVILFIACAALPGTLGTIFFIEAPPDSMDKADWVKFLMVPTMLVYFGSPILIMVLGFTGILPLSQDFWEGHDDPGDLALGYGVTAVFSIIFVLIGIAVGCAAFIPMYYFIHKYDYLTIGAAIVGSGLVTVAMTLVWWLVMFLLGNFGDLNEAWWSLDGNG